MICEGSARPVMWNDGWTPKFLLKGDANVYRQIGIAIKAGAWRKAGLVNVAGTLAATGGGERRPRAVLAFAASAASAAALALYEEHSFRDLGVSSKRRVLGVEAV